MSFLCGRAQDAVFTFCVSFNVFDAFGQIYRVKSAKDKKCHTHTGRAHLSVA